MTKDEILNYWVSSSDNDLKVMSSLLKNRHYGLALFMGHLVLDEVTTFNIKARYPDYKDRFYKKATKKFTADYITKIKDFRRWLKKRVKQ